MRDTATAPRIAASVGATRADLFGALAAARAEVDALDSQTVERHNPNFEGRNTPEFMALLEGFDAALSKVLDAEDALAASDYHNPLTPSLPDDWHIRQLASFKA